MTTALPIVVRALSNADSLGLLGQQSVAEAARGINHRLIGGHMVRLLLRVYPTDAAAERATRDADTAVDDVEVVGPLVGNLLAQGFVQERGNLLVRRIDVDRAIEVNVLLSRRGHSHGLRPQDVPGVGQVDTLPELAFALSSPGLLLDVAARLDDGATISYTALIPDLEAAVILKAHAWKARGLQLDKDLADLHTLLEIREAHPHTAWRLLEPELRGTRRDAAAALDDLAVMLGNPRSIAPIPRGLNRPRMIALIRKHITAPGRA